jgi:hypothetical protein
VFSNAATLFTPQVPRVRLSSGVLVSIYRGAAPWKGFITTTGMDAAAGVGTVGELAQLSVTADDGNALTQPNAIVASENPWTYNMAVGRKTLFATINWQTSVTTPLTILSTFHLPQDGLATTLNTHPFEVYQTWRGDIVLDFSAIGNEFYYGQLLVVAVPFDVSQTTNLSNKASLLQYDHIIIDASMPSNTEFRLTYTNVVNLMLTQPLSPSVTPPYTGYPTFGAFLSQMYTVYVMTWEPLQIVSGTATGMTINAFIRLENSRFESPAPEAVSVPHFIKRNGFGVARTELRVRQERVEREREALDAMQVFKDWYTKFVNQPAAGVAQGNTNTSISIDHVNNSSLPIDTQGSTIKGSLEASMPMPPMLDAPNYTGLLPNIIRRAFYNMANASGVVTMDRLSQYPSSQSISTPEIVESTSDDMTWESLVGKYSWVEDFYITSSNVVNDILTSGVICPCEALISDPPTVGGPGSLLNFSILDYYAFKHNYWYGTICYRLTVVMTGYHTVNLRICSHYYQTVVPASLENAVNGSYFDVQFNGRDGTRVFEFEFPYISPTGDWKRVPNGAATPMDILEFGCGVWSIRMNSSLTYTDQVPSTIRCYLEQKGRDMRFYGYNSRSACITSGYSSQPYLLFGEAQAAVRIAPDTVMPPPTVNHVVSEVSKNLADILRRPCPFIEHEFSAAKPLTTQAFSSVLYVAFQHKPFADHYFEGGNFVYTPTGGTYANQQMLPYRTNTIYDRDALSSEALFWQYYRGSLRYTVEVLFPTTFAGSSGNAYTQNCLLSAEVEYVPYDLLPTRSAIPGAPADRGTMIQYYCERQMKNSERTDLTARICPGTTCQKPNPPKIVLTPQNPIGQLEVPFDGIYDKRFVIGPQNYNGSGTGQYVNASATEGGLILVRVLVEAPYGMDTNLGHTVPVHVRIHRAAGDDFRFIRTLARPPTYWNLSKVTNNTGSGDPIYDYQLFPSCLFDGTTGWKTSGTPFKIKPGTIISEKRRPRRRVLVEVDSDSEISVLGESQSGTPTPPPTMIWCRYCKAYRIRFCEICAEWQDIPQGEAQMLGGADLPDPGVVGVFNNITLTPGSYAHFLHRVYAGDALLSNIPCAFPVPAYHIHVRNAGAVNEYGTPIVTHTAELSIREHSSVFSLNYFDYLLPAADTKLLFNKCLVDMLTWATVNMNGTIDFKTQVKNWLVSHEAENIGKVAFSIFNEMQRQVSGLTVVVQEDAPEGQQHALQHPVSVTVSCATDKNTKWTARAVTGSKHSSKRDAAALVLQHMREEFGLPTA